MDPLPAVALEVRTVLSPVQNEASPVMFVVGNAFSLTTNAAEVDVQPLLLVTVTVYVPSVVAV